ncbi:MAG: Replication factor C small subunit, partial [Candidatus Aenigmarchaeota archaeon]|nr:Replication factor C small subunit [Candidatus Aenigmarchaeota archaeon]
MNEFQIWTEKYRPTEFTEVVGQENIIERIAAFVDSKQIPHLLFAGPAGCGKST